MDKKSQNMSKQALLDKALGYTTQEITEEYGISGEEFVLQKRKTSTKTYPPDLSALQMLLEENVEENNKYMSFSKEELEEEKIRLIKLLKEKK